MKQKLRDKIRSTILGDIYGIVNEPQMLFFYILYLFRFLFKIKNNKFFFESMHGNSFGGNIKPIYNKLKEKSPESFCVWSLNDKITVEDDGFLRVKPFSLSYYFHLITSHYIISDIRINTTLFPVKRKGQIYLQTWHGTPLKKIEGDAVSLGEDYKYYARQDSKKIDLLVSGSKYISSIFRSAFWYDGEIIETGTPRNDIFFSQLALAEIKVKKYLKLSKEDRMILYAPTFRNDGSMPYNIDVDSILNTLKKKTGENWFFAVRLHPNMLKDKIMKRIEQMLPKTINVTAYPDMNELLCGTDILITDYSSSMFDYALTKRPCFIYAEDSETYDRGFYIRLDTLPFPFACNNEELIKNIKDFDDVKYQLDLNKFQNRFGYVEEGSASEKVIECLLKK